jgi:TPR repeat protein
MSTGINDTIQAEQDAASWPASWAAARELFVKGEKEQALMLCENEPCEMPLEVQRYLGWEYYEMAHHEAALKWFGKAVSQGGDADAIFGMGCVHFAHEDFSIALQYFQRAADSGHARACHWLGNFYLCGLGVPSDEEMAISWYKRAAAQEILISERILLDLAGRKKVGFSMKIRLIFKRIRLILKALMIIYRNGVSDSRLKDIK